MPCVLVTKLDGLTSMYRAGIVLPSISMDTPGDSQNRTGGSGGSADRPLLYP